MINQDIPGLVKLEKQTNLLGDIQLFILLLLGFGRLSWHWSPMEVICGSACLRGSTVTAATCLLPQKMAFNVAS